MDYKCDGCKKLIGKEDGRKKVKRVEPKNGATITIEQGFAPVIKCPCGMVTILMKGSL